jgi:hypothetical protein
MRGIFDKMFEGIRGLNKCLLRGHIAIIEGKRYDWQEREEVLLWDIGDILEKFKAFKEGTKEHPESMLFTPKK